MHKYFIINQRPKINSLVNSYYITRKNICGNCFPCNYSGYFTLALNVNFFGTNVLLVLNLPPIAIIKILKRCQILNEEKKMIH